MARAAVTIHYPYIEAGRPRPLCGAARANLDWTTAAGKVTCVRCRELLRRSESAEPPRARGAEAAWSAKVP